MLWTDRRFVTVELLSAIDSEVAEVAEANNIALTGYPNILDTIAAEVSNELLKMLVSFGGSVFTSDVSANHHAAVMYTGTNNSVRYKASLSQVVVSGRSERAIGHLMHWAAIWGLHMLYRDAYARTVKDRYESKMRQFKSELQRRHTPTLTSLGIPLTVNPLSAPAAYMEYNPGTWSVGNLSTTPGSGTLNTTLYACVTYVCMEGGNAYISSSDPGNGESHPSETVSIVITAGNVLGVSIASLNPPTGVQSPRQAAISPISVGKATHWNLYVGQSADSMYLQNPTPIPIATKTYTLTGDPATLGALPGIGQYATRFMSVSLTRQRS